MSATHGGRRSGTGGRRPGAGRKSKVVEQEWQNFAQNVLSKINAEKRLVAIATKADPALSFEIIKYLVDRILGKPAQAVNLSGNINVIERLRAGRERALLAAKDRLS